MKVRRKAQLPDLNEIPVVRNRKRKRSEVDFLSTNENEDSLNVSVGRVLRSRTVAITDGEKQVVEMVIDNVEERDEGEIKVSQKRKKMKRPRGRPPKVKNGDCRSGFGKKDDKVTVNEGNKGTGRGRKKLKGRIGRSPKATVDEGTTGTGRGMKKPRGKIGRPPKAKDGISQEMDNELLGKQIVAVDEGNVGDGQGRKKLRGRVGRPPKTKNELSLIVLEKEEVREKTVDESNKGTGRGREKLKDRRGRPPKAKETVDEGKKGKGRGRKKFVGRIVLPAIVKKRVTGKVLNKKKGLKKNGVHTNIDSDDLRKEELANQKEKGRRKEKQLVRDQIVSMLKKAGWTIEHRQRQSKDYLDAVYVDREGRTYWSVTLAYRKLKERIDGGTADEQDIAAFSPIPEDVFSMLFRISTKGKGKKENVEGKTSKEITKGESSKSKLIDRRRKKVGAGSMSKEIPEMDSSNSGSLGRGVKSRLNKGKKRTLCARRHGEGSDGENELYKGKRTLLSWMIDLGVVPPTGKVSYKTRKNGKVMLKGIATRDGICCDCCGEIQTVREFESHAGSKTQKQNKNIYLESGVSLFECLKDSWAKHLATVDIEFVSVDMNDEDPNDDICNICADGGDLLCCDACPSAFHNVCLGIEKVPSGDWICVCCSCKFCGVAEEITSKIDDDHDLPVSDLFTCHLCEQKFHLPCVREKDTRYADYNNTSFCGPDCQKIYDQLQTLIGVKHEVGGGYSYTLLQHRVESSNSSAIESNSKLALAFSIMDECFMPIIDHQCGKNIIHNIVYSCGSNLRRLNYKGFFTIILEKEDEVFAAASLRIHGIQLAEMPFIGTRFRYRRQGMCSRLLKAIETVLCSLGIEKLIIPAISELNETWKNVFGFMPIEESKRKEMRFISMVAFPGVSMLQKPLLNQIMQLEHVDSPPAMQLQEDTSSEVQIPNLNEVALMLDSAAHLTDGLLAADSAEVGDQQQILTNAGMAGVEESSGQANLGGNLDLNLDVNLGGKEYERDVCGDGSGPAEGPSCRG